jgi:hypothetical protein
MARKSILDKLSFDKCTPMYSSSETTAERRLRHYLEALHDVVMPILSRLSSKHETAGNDAKFHALEEACREVRKAIERIAK